MPKCTGGLLENGQSFLPLTEGVQHPIKYLTTINDIILICCITCLLQDDYAETKVEKGKGFDRMTVIVVIFVILLIGAGAVTATIFIMKGKLDCNQSIDI